MSKQVNKAVVPSSFNFTVEAFAVGQVAGKSGKAVAALIERAIDNGVLPENLDDARDDFYAGFMSGLFNWTAKAARAWLADPAVKKRVAKGETPTPFQRGFATARMQWSRGREQAGLAKAHKGRAAKVVTEPSDDDSADTGNRVDAMSLSDATFIVPSGLDAAGVLAIIANVDGLLAKLRNANAKALTGDLGSELRKTLDAFHDGVGKAQYAALSGAKPAEPVAPRKVRKAQVAAPIAAPIAA